MSNLNVETFCDSDMAQGAEIWLESVANPGMWLDKFLRLSEYANAESFVINTWSWSCTSEYICGSTGEIQLQGQNSRMWWQAKNGGSGI